MDPSAVPVVNFSELRDVGRLLQRHLLLIVLFALIGGGAGLAWALYGPVRYESRVTLVTPRPVLVMPEGYAVPPMVGVAPDRASIESLCTAPDLVREVVDRLNAEPATVALAGRKKLRPRNLTRMMYVRLNSNEMFTLQVRSASPAFAHRAAQVWSQVVIERIDGLYRSGLDQMQALGQKMRETRDQRSAALAGLSALREDPETASRLAALDQARQSMQRLAAALPRLELLREEAEALHAAVDAREGDAQQPVSTGQALTLRRLEREALSAWAMDRAVVQDLDSSWAADANAVSKAAALSRTSGVLESLGTATQAVAARQAEGAQRVASLMAELEGYEQQRSQLEASEQLAVERLTLLRRQQTTLEMLNLDQGEVVKVVSPALLPASPDAPPLSVLVGLSTAAAGLLGVGLAMIRGPQAPVV